jgi:predicted dehydrogenase
MREDLPPADTFSAAMIFANGTVASYNGTYTSGAPYRTAIEIVGDGGALRVNHGLLEISENGKMRNIPITPVDSVKEELAVFADAVREGKPHRSAPLDALRDVAIVEAILNAGASGQRVTVEDVSDLES